MCAAPEVILECCGHERRQFRHPMRQQEASPRHLSERKAAAVPCCVLIRISEGLHYGVQHLIRHLLHRSALSLPYSKGHGCQTPFCLLQRFLSVCMQAVLPSGQVMTVLCPCTARPSDVQESQL